jgi:hypothetical protein
LADLVNCSDRDWQRGAANRISQKHVDFVLSCPRSSRIVAAIELDDCSHERSERRRRDNFVNGLFWQMQVRLIRIPAQTTYDNSTLIDHFAKAGLAFDYWKVASE